MQSLGRTIAGAAILALVAGPLPASARTRGHYLVFFEQFSANITPQGKDIISQAAAEAAIRKPRTIRIEARANAAGTPDATMKIAETRAAVVRDMLVADGVPAALLQLVPIGQAGTTDTGVGPRRVDILFRN